MMATTFLQNHNTKQLFRVAAGVALAAVFAFTLVQANSFAQADSDSATANSLKVSPLRTDVTADPGETKIVKVTVTNPTSQKVSVRVIQNDFVAGDEDGTPAIILEETEYAESHSLKRFMTPVESVMLEGNESKTIDVELKVPADAEPGGYFGVVRFAPTSPDSGGQVNVSASVASLILLRVNGDAPEKLDLTEFVVQQDGRKKTFFVNYDNITVTARFENTGNVQAGPFGKVSLSKGDTVVHEADFNNKEQRDMVLPSSARRWTVPLEHVSGIGRYTVTATFTYGADNKTIDVSESFWVIPRNAIIAGSVGILVVIGAIVGGVIYFRRRRNSFPSSSFDARRKR